MSCKHILWFRRDFPERMETMVFNFKMALMARKNIEVNKPFKLKPQAADLF